MQPLAYEEISLPFILYRESDENDLLVSHANPLLKALFIFQDRPKR